MSRSAQQKSFNKLLSDLPKFTPINEEYYIYSISQITSSVHLRDLIRLAGQTTRFTINTEHDRQAQQSALIQIEFVNRDRSAIVLIQTCHLPDQTSILFSLLRELFQIVLQSSNVLYGWGDMKYELERFVHFGLFSRHTLAQINFVNVQSTFKQWYNRTFLHRCGLPSCSDDNELCKCLFRPMKFQEIDWPLQKAIAVLFWQFLDKTLTRSRWSMPFFISETIGHYSKLSNKTSKTFSEQHIFFAVNDCLAVTKLWMILEMNWTQAELQQYRLCHKK